MFRRYALQLKPLTKTFHTSIKLHEEFENPILRTIRILRDDIMLRNRPGRDEHGRLVSRVFPHYVDIVIIGGGAIGSSIAYWLKKKTNFDALRIVVIEKDPTYRKCSTTLSVGGLRQQFSLPENIQMSLYGAEFLRTIKKHFGKEAEVNFTPHGYLVLASEAGAEQLIDNSKLQNELGAMNRILNKDQLKERFPWMNVSDVDVGCLGLEKEGWFDPWSLLGLLRRGASDLGTQYVHGEVVEFLFTEMNDVIMDGVEGCYEGTNNLVVKLPDGQRKNIQFAACILAAGSESGEVAQLARIGTGRGMLSVPLPVEKRKRYVYSFQCQGEPPGINTPMTIDHTGMYFRRDGLGGGFICGMSPEAHEEPSCDNLDVDYKFFDDRIWPILAKRVPAFEAVKASRGWSGYYDYNTYDENGIIGPHPYYQNMYIATGFSGHGIQQAPAVGRAISELILDGRFQTIDLTRLGFDRLIVDKPMYEIGIY
ncbi:hypothetical protein NQ315_016397 [Exocentrus adspersus]|uniref:FAD dependent oxidoreductase domain-containing protein n=1 Tax=Exocentrus adspersus TaxID=1586481 RepID=A0AAV8VQJ0_9CUCU|nr:hypothetical protein NQ315_016397 [Exocentrus adspersus]